jgi:peptide/nickel transport system ATP-binding protein
VPDPDIDRPLDFHKLRTDRFSNPADWPEPYRLAEGEMGRMTEIEPHHCVRLNGALAREAA